MALNLANTYGYVAPYLAREYMVQKGDGPLLFPDLIGYVETVRPVFGDCPLLKQKLDSGEASHKLTDWMVKYYNKNCSGDPK